jgi:hypothetical protein
MLAVVSLLAGGLAGCAAPRGLSGRVLERSDKGYRIEVPAGWEPIEMRADLALRHPVLGAAVMAHGTCEGKAPERSLAVLARHLRFGLREVRELVEEPVTVAGQAAVRSRFAARLGDEPVVVEAVTVRARGCAYDLAVVAPPDRMEWAVREFQRFLAGFALTGGTP